MKLLTRPKAFQFGNQTQYFLGAHRCLTMTVAAAKMEMPIAAQPEEEGIARDGAVTAYATAVQEEMLGAA
jgi:hypothetical protein